MSDIVIQVDDLWKKYRLGVLGTGSLRHDFNRWCHRVLGKADPYAKVGETLKTEKLKAEKLKSEYSCPISEFQRFSVSAFKKDVSVSASKEDISAFQRFSVSAFKERVSAFKDVSDLREDEMWALREVSFEVKRGEILGIIGRNGAGKSTLLKILSRVTAPTSGEVRVKGRIASLLEVGTGFHPELTGRENVFLNGAILGMTKAEIKRKFDEIVDFSGVEKFLDTPVKRYSSGMYVRLAFAVAAHLEPEILIVDEVLAVGDAQFQKKCLGKMQNVAKGGRTVLFVSHNMGAIATLCGRGLLLSEGRVSVSGTTENCIQKYLSVQGLEKSLSVEDCRLSELKHDRRLVEFVEIRCGNESGQLGYGSDPRFVLTLFSDQGVSNVSIGGTISDATGAAIGTFFTEHCVSVPAKKAIQILISLDLPELVPGHYSAGFSVGRGSESAKRVDYDVVIGMPTFEVVSVGQAGIVSEWWPSWGHLCLNSRVSVKPTV